MIKRIATVVLILLIVCSGKAVAIEPDIEPSDEITVDDVLAVAAEMPKYDQAAEELAKLIWGEARGVGSTMEKAAVVWCALNRVDVISDGADYPTDIIRIVQARKQFTGYSARNPVTEELKELAVDVVSRWLLEKRGVESVGRVLPEEYLWFAGRSGHNWFRDNYRQPYVYWDWSLEDPY